ncbi:MAG: SpoIIE family protein phosphatase [Luteimonas sp.]
MGVAFSGHITRVVPVDESSQVGQVRREASSVALQAGFDDVDVGRVAIVATEIATNVLRHGQGGRVLLSLVEGRAGKGVEMCGIDRGPGFSLAQCLPDGYSTAGSQGQGLGAIQRQAAVLDVWSDAQGAVVLARVYAADAHDHDVAYGALRIPLRHEVVCGDGWRLDMEGPRLTVTLVDGLGHGLQASEAAELGIAAAADACAQPADEIVRRMHVRMSRSRGGAAGVCRYDADTGQLQFAGIGNISAVLYESGGARGLPSHPGIVGGMFRRVHPFAFQARPGSLLLMHSDGLQTRWNFTRYAGLAYRHPALVVAVLQRDYDRGRDDTGIIAVRLGGTA